MAFPGKPYKITVANKKEDDDASSGYVHTTGRNSTVDTMSNIASSYDHSSTRENSVSSRNNYREINVCNQTRKNDIDKSTGTEICIGCLLKGGEKKQATHFCKTCDTYGRYICYSCMLDHNIWAGKNHDVVSLSVDKETDSDWQRKERQVQTKPGKTDYHDIDSWFQQSSPDDDGEYGVLNDRDMASIDATRNSNVSDYTWANSSSDAMGRSRISRPDTFQEVNQHFYEDGYADYTFADCDLDVMRGLRMPHPDAYQSLEQHLDEDIYEDFTTFENEIMSSRINAPNDNLGQASERSSQDPCCRGGIFTKSSRHENIQAQRQETNNNFNRHALYRRSFVVDGQNQPYITYDNTKLEYTPAEFNNEIKNNVKYYSLRPKEKSCRIM